MQLTSSLSHQRCAASRPRRARTSSSPAQTVRHRQVDSQHTLHSQRPNVMASAQTETTTSTSQAAEQQAPIPFIGVHHVAFLCEDLKRSMDFYQGMLGLKVNPERPNDKLPYDGSWLWIGPDMLHLMEVPNPDPKEGRPEHGGRDRHFCTGVSDIAPLVARLDAAGVKYTMSKSGRKAVFFRDPDMNTIEVVETEPWR